MVLLVLPAHQALQVLLDHKDGLDLRDLLLLFNLMGGVHRMYTHRDPYLIADEYFEKKTETYITYNRCRIYNSSSGEEPLQSGPRLHLLEILFLLRVK